MKNRSAMIVVTGYEPYGGFDVNPSEQVALSLGKKEFRNCKVETVVLPVSFRLAFLELRNELDKRRPDTVISMGLMPYASALRVERIAVNMKDYDGVPDNEGVEPQDEFIDPGAPAAYFATIQVRRIFEDIAREGIPVIISNSAGTHLCNFVMYNVLHYISKKRWNTKAGFIHLPLLPQQVEQLMHRHPNTPSMPLDVMTKGIGIAVETVASAMIEEA